MTLLFMDGFDHYNEIRRKWIVASGFDNPTFESGRFGGQAIEAQFQNHASSIKQSLGNQTELFVGFAFFPPGFGSGNSHLRFYAAAGGNPIANVIITSVGEVSLVVSGQTVTSTTANISSAQWHYIEVHYTAKSSGGIFEVRVDEAVVVTMTGDTIGGATPDDIDSVGLVTDGTNTPRYLYDDLYILNGSGATNNNYLGDVRINAMYADSNGNSNDFTSQSGGANFEEVDEITLDDGTYVESGLLLAKEDYNNDSFVTRGLTPGTIHAVQTCNATLRTDAGTVRFKNEMVIAGVRFTDDVEHDSVTGNYFINVYPRDTDPSDDATWTEAKVDAVGSGITLTFRDS